MASERQESPWRSQRLDEYYARHEPPTADSLSDIRSLSSRAVEDYFILWRGNHFYMILHPKPYNNGHLLIVPYREVTGYRELTASEQDVLADLIERSITWLRETFQAEGFNVGMNEGNFAVSAEPEHLHVHVVPRWNGDTNFMTAINDTTVVPESLEDTYQRLREVIHSGDTDA